MRNLRNEVRKIVQEELNSYSTGRSMLTEIGDGSAKPYKFSKFDPNLGQYDDAKTTFKTDSGLLYDVILNNIYKYLDVSFTANDTYDVTNKGEMYRVMSTLITIIEGVFKKTELKGIRYSPYAKGNDGGKGRDTLYRLFITSFAKKNGLKVEFITGGSVIFAEFTDPTGKFLMVSLREKLLNLGKYRITKKDLNVKGDLDLFKTGITSLPDGLRVSGDLYLNMCTSLKTLPNELKVRGSIILQGTPLANMYSKDEIRDTIEDNGGYVKRDIVV